MGGACARRNKGEEDVTNNGRPVACKPRESRHLHH
jgi:hypothetical protein